MSLNKVQLIGNIGRDPEIRFTQKQEIVATFSIATSERWTDKTTGEKKERTEWHRIVVFEEHIAKFVEKYLKKGSKVYIEGEIRSRKWQTKDNQDRYVTEVVIPRFGGQLISLSKMEGDGPPPAGAVEDYGNEKTLDGPPPGWDDNTPPPEDNLPMS